MSVSDNSWHQLVSDAVVKISVPKKMNFSARDYSPPFIDSTGHIVETWGVSGGSWQPTEVTCGQQAYSSANYFREACLHFASGASFEQPVPISFSGTGYFSHASGKILTARHLVDGCELYFEGKMPFFCPILEIEVNLNGRTKILKGATVLALSLATGSEGELDYALLDLDFISDRTLKVCSSAPSDGDLVQAFGFPITSNRETEGRYLNADGTLRFSSGLLLSPEEPAFQNETRPLLGIKSDYFFSDVDAVAGNSGGPFVSEENCVLGLVTRASWAGDHTTDKNVNTDYLLSASNPLWVAKSTAICSDLKKYNLSHFVEGC